MNPNAGRPYGGNRRVNDGPNRMEGQNKIEVVKLSKAGVTQTPTLTGR